MTKKKDLKSIARQLLELCAADNPWRPNSTDIQRKWKLSVSQVDCVKDHAKKISDAESGGSGHSWWGWDPGVHPSQGHFRFCPVGDNAVARRMKDYSFNSWSASSREAWRSVGHMEKMNFIDHRDAMRVRSQVTKITNSIDKLGRSINLAPVFQEPKAA